MCALRLDGSERVQYKPIASLQYDYTLLCLCLILIDAKDITTSSHNIIVY